MRTILCGAGFLLAAVALIGCDGEERLYDVTGTVTSYSLSCLLYTSPSPRDS